MKKRIIDTGDYIEVDDICKDNKYVKAMLRTFAETTEIKLSEVVAVFEKIGSLDTLVIAYELACIREITIMEAYGIIKRLARFE
jgi:hypothetical protein